MLRSLLVALAIPLVALSPSTTLAAVRLIGITGNQEANPAEDETLFNISLSDAATTRLFSLTHIPDTDTIGFNPVDGLVYHFNGSESYSNNPSSNGYRDNQYLETVNLDTQALTAIFNSNPPPSPDSSQSFGLPAPRPDWVLPAEIRLDTQDSPDFRQTGVDEYHGARGVAWSDSEKLFYIADGGGFYKVTPTGDSTFVGLPASEGGDMKGIAFVEVAGQQKLLAGSKETGLLYEIDPATGQEIGTPVQVQVPISLVDPTLVPTKRILGLTTHPETGVLYGLTEPDGGDPTLDRQLVTINPVTGIAAIVGILDTPNPGDAAFSSIAFVGFTSGPAGDFDGNGKVDGADFLLWQRGGSPSPLSAGDLATWKANFGAAATAVVGAVPEPTALVSAMVAVGSMGVWRSRR